MNTMKIIALADIHEAGTKYLDAFADDLTAADVVLLVGDLTNGGKRADGERVLNAVRQYNPSILAVPGNWDGREVVNYLADEGISLHARCLYFREFAFIGVGGSLSYHVGTPTEFTEQEFATFLAKSVEGL